MIGKWCPTGNCSNPTQGRQGWKGPKNPSTSPQWPHVVWRVKAAWLEVSLWLPGPGILEPLIWMIWFIAPKNQFPSISWIIFMQYSFIFHIISLLSINLTSVKRATSNLSDLVTTAQRWAGDSAWAFSQNRPKSPPKKQPLVTLSCHQSFPQCGIHGGPYLERIPLLNQSTIFFCWRFGGFPVFFGYQVPML